MYSWVSDCIGPVNSHGLYNSYPWIVAAPQPKIVIRAALGKELRLVSEYIDASVDKTCLK